MHLRDAGVRHGSHRARERTVVLRREADDHVGREVEVLERLDPRTVLPDRVAPAHLPEDGVVTRLQGDVQVTRHDRRLAHGLDQVDRDVIDLDRGEAEPREALDLARRPDQPRQRQPGAAIAETAEIDAGEHDLSVALGDPSPDLCEDCSRRAASRRAADEGDDAEGARERAAVLDLDEGADAVEPVLGPDTAERADIPGHGVGDLLAPPGDDANVRGHPGERLGREIRGAPGDVDAGVAPGRPSRGLPRFRDGLVRDAAGVDHGDVCGAARFGVPVGEQPFADRLRIGVRHLAAEEPGREGGHGSRA